MLETAEVVEDGSAIGSNAAEKSALVKDRKGCIDLRAVVICSVMISRTVSTGSRDSKAGS